MIEAIRYVFYPVQRRACSYPGLIYAAVIGMLLAAAIVLTATAGNAQEIDTQRAALVHIGPSEGGSGVCISADGWILTAAHCVVQETPSVEGWRGRGEPTIVIPKAVKVRFPQQDSRSARVAAVWRPDRKTDLALLKVDARGGLPFLPYAKASPGIGEAITSIGYPGGHFARFESDVEFVGVTGTTFGPMDLIQTTHRGNPGHSGGPLLNARGEVCGICSMGSVDFMKNGKVERSPQISLWARCEYFDQILKEGRATPLMQLTAATATNKPVIHVWGGAKCKPCIDAYNDVASLKINYQGQRIDLFCEVIFHDSDKESTEANRLGISTLPTFIIEATGERIEGYPGAAALNAKLAQILNAPVALPPPGNASDPQDDQRTPLIASVPRPRSPPTEATADDAEPPKVDATGVRVLVLVRKHDLGMMASGAVSVVEKFAVTGVRKKIQTALGNKADVDLVFERTMPARYAELIAASGTEVKRNALFVILIPQKFTGVVGNVAKLVEGKLKSFADGDWKFSSVLTIAERTDPDGYKSMMEASEQDDTIVADTASDQNWLTYLWVSITSGFAGIVETIFGHKAKKAAQ
jgi:S1-C subfamily serine protease